MPSFLRDLAIRRRSKPPVQSSDSSSFSSNGEPPHTNNSSSTLKPLGPSCDQPSPSHPPLLSSTSSPHLPSATVADKKFSTRLSSISLNYPLPRMHSARYSISVPTSAPSKHNSTRCPPAQGQSSIGLQRAITADRLPPASSPLAPRVLSVADNAWLHQKVLLVFGQCGDPNQPVDGQLTVVHDKDAFPSTTVAVCDGYFKALVVLHPGPNKLRLDFTSPKFSSPAALSSWMNVNYLPLSSSPPLQLCILLAKDSPETYDAVPERVQSEGNGLDMAKKKFRMAAYLWQAFTAEQMYRHGFGRRCYRYEEEWQPGTCFAKDAETGQMRNEAKIHVVRLDKTTKEIQDLDLAQQEGPAKDGSGLYDIANEAVAAYFGRYPGQTQYVSCMFLDSRWDKEAGVIRAHAARDRSDGSIDLAIFGSHCLQSYPSCIDQVADAFSDSTYINTDFVANDCNNAGRSWEAVNIGIGAHLHEVGHLLGCPHQECGVMLRDYNRLNRTFTCRGPDLTKMNEQSMRLYMPQDECVWHRLDVLRFRFHPTFQLPTDLSAASVTDRGVQVWAVENDAVLITALTGVAWIEIIPEGDDVCHYWIEYLEQNGPRHIQLTEKAIKDRLPAEKKKKRKIKLRIFSCGGGSYEVEDFHKLTSADSKLKFPDGRRGFRGFKLGFSQMQGTTSQELLLGRCEKKSTGQPRLLLNVRVHHGDYLNGLEFFYQDGDCELFGNRGGKAGGTDFSLDVRKGELLLGFYVRAGVWIEAIQIMTTTGRRSEIFGRSDGGSGHILIPPRGYDLAGIYGTCGSWLDGFGLIVAR